MTKKLTAFIRRVLLKFLFTYDMQVVMGEGAKLPTRAHKNDAGYDLYVSKAITIDPGQWVNINTGFHIKSDGAPLWLYLVGRSSTMMRHGIIVDTGVIDDGYTGELLVKAYNIGKKPVSLFPGMRIGQMIPMVVSYLNFRLVDKFRVKAGERGVKGFGSSGV